MTILVSLSARITLKASIGDPVFIPRMLSVLLRKHELKIQYIKLPL